MTGRGTWVLLGASAALLLAGCVAIDRPNPLRGKPDRAAVGQADKAKPAPAAAQQPAKTDIQDGQANRHAFFESEATTPKRDDSVVLASGQAGSSTGAAGSSERRAAAPGANADPAGSTGANGRAGSPPSDQVRSLLRSADEALTRGDTPAALAQIRAAAQSNPQDPQIPISAGALLLRQNHPQEAAGLMAESAQQFPNCPAIHRMLGTAQYRLGDYQRAQVAFQQALSLDKSSALSYFLMGCTLAKLGQQGAAEAHLRQAEMLDPRYGAER